MASIRLYGEIAGVPEGTTFPDRVALQQAGVHRPRQAGISGGQDGADSIVVSGGYPDDKDSGNEIVYTGHGGRDPNTNRQIADQELARGNLGLVRSQHDERPVRVIRGSGGEKEFSPEVGYRYDGLFRVVEHWQEKGRDGFNIWRFRLRKIPDDESKTIVDGTIPGVSSPESVAQEESPAEHANWASDAPADTDTLRRDTLASVLAARLSQFSRKEPDVSFLLHLDGAWGSGKSTLLKLLAPRLEERYVVVPFDCWQHAKVDPPWWGLLVTLRQHVAHALPWWRRPILRISDALQRTWRGSAPYVSTILIGIFLAGVLALLFPALLDISILGQMTKDVMATLGVLGSIAVGVLAIGRFVWWDSARGARRLEQTHTNPMQEVTWHFSWLLAKSPKRVVFFLDDLDRCGNQYVVDFLDTVQTLVRDAPRRQGKRGDGKAAYFVVAAHGNWLRRAYETAHEPFRGAVDEPGRGLGHLFLDKLFQLTVPIPTLGPETKQQYFDAVLGVQTPDQESVDDESSQVLDGIDNSENEQEVLEALRSAGPRQRELSAARAVERMSEPSIAEITEHALQKFAPLLDGNPRSMKRFVNAYSVLRAARTLEGVTVDSDVLAFWTVLGLRWPVLTEYIEANLSSLADGGSTKIFLENLAELHPSLPEDPELQRVLANAPVRLTPELIRDCCGAAMQKTAD